MITDDDLLISFLKAVPLLSALKEEMLAALASKASKSFIKGGEWVFREGEIGRKMYVIRTGLVEVIAESVSPPATLRILGRSEFFGELALIENVPHSASIRTLRDTELIRIDQIDFLQLIEENPEVSLDLNRQLCKRLLNQRLLRVSGSGLSKRPQYIGILTLFSMHRDVPFNRICAAIRNIFTEELDIGFLNQDAVCLSDKNPTNEREFGRLLDRYERTHELVVLIAEKSTSSFEWIRFCLRQADRTVIIAHVNTSPSHETILGDSIDGYDLALFGPETRGEQVVHWLDTVRPLSHFHLRDDERLNADIARMCRRLLSVSIGIVLCGGGARALSHIGVVTGLLEAGIQIDRIGGVSMGAFIGALFAMGYGPEEVRRLCLLELGPNPFDDYNFPAVSLIKGKKARRMMRRIFGQRTIESLPIDFYCLSSDLISAQAVVHRRAEIVTSVGASLSIPGIAPPIRKADQLLVDGGVLNNLPTDVMREQGEGPIIASDLFAGKTIEDTGGQRPRGPISLMSRFFIRDSFGLPNIFQTLTRTTTLSSMCSRAEKQAIADMVVCPNMEHISFFDWNKIDKAIESGYEETGRVIEAARQDGSLDRILSKRPKLVFADRGVSG